MKMIETMRKRWLELLGSPEEAHMRVEKHPLQLYFGSDVVGKPVFFLITAERPDLPNLSDAVRVERRKRESDGKWALLLTLDHRRLLEPFLTFCCELARQSQQSADESAALSALYRTMHQWRELLLPKAPRRLSVEELRGFFAELWIGLYRFDSDPHEVVTAWVGPFAAAQDYRFPNGLGVEVKAIRPDARQIEISSVEQLDPADVPDLRLAVLTVDDVLPGTDESHTVQDLLSHWRGVLETQKAIDDFDARVLAVGFDEFDEQYLEFAFKVTAAKEYQVVEGFPRLRVKDTPAGVREVKFSIDTAAIREFGTDLHRGN